MDLQDSRGCRREMCPVIILCSFSHPKFWGGGGGGGGGGGTQNR